MDRRKFMTAMGLGATGLMLPDILTAGPKNKTKASGCCPAQKIKPITGTWIEFQHHLPNESEYWDKPLAAFTCDQWKRKIKEMHEVGMEYLVLMSTALFDKAMYDSELAPKFPLGCDDPIEAVMSAADECGMKFFISNGYWGDVHKVAELMVSPRARLIRQRSMEELASRYGHHESFYGWYFPNEAQLQPYFTDEVIRYVNDCSDFARKLMPASVNMIAPYYVKLAKNDDTFVRQLEKLNIDIIAYQDGVGVNHSRLEDTAGYFFTLYNAHQRASRARLWADMELFYFESGTHGNLMPADFDTRILRQMENISPYVDKILCYQYTGVMNKPGTDIVSGHPESLRLYNQYTAWLKKQGYMK